MRKSQKTKRATERDQDRKKFIIDKEILEDGIPNQINCLRILEEELKHPRASQGKVIDRPSR
jgi:hypothetical protein